MNFEEVYGKLGKGFIHIHHITPLYQIGKEYKVDYKKDLAPVCPNCHAMLHRKIDGKEFSIQELKELIKK
ncbi:HNH endonuclease [Empedobacter falsenii]